jgi:hypothetical protein
MLFFIKKILLITQNTHIFLSRWALSTNHKDIGSSFTVFGLVLFLVNITISFFRLNKKVLLAVHPFLWYALVIGCFLSENSWCNDDSDNGGPLWAIALLVTAAYLIAPKLTSTPKKEVVRSPDNEIAAEAVNYVPDHDGSAISLIPQSIPYADQVYFTLGSLYTAVICLVYISHFWFGVTFQYEELADSDGLIEWVKKVFVNYIASAMCCLRLAAWLRLVYYIVCIIFNIS